MKKVDIILIPFPFSDLSGNKNRPAIVLIDSEDEVSACFITAQLKWQPEFDYINAAFEHEWIKKSFIDEIEYVCYN